MSTAAPTSNPSADMVDSPVVVSPQRERSLCAMRELAPRDLPPMPETRVRLIRELESKWANGTVLHYSFFNGAQDGRWVTSNGSRTFLPWKGAPKQLDVVRRGFKAWTDVGIGVRFEEVASRDDAEIRIGFEQGDGAWSYVGRDILTIGRDERTMNFGWDLASPHDDVDTPIHEIGHTLGFPHEHQNPNTGIEWDEEKVYADLAGSPNFWSRQTTFHNIIRKIPAYTVEGSNWDPNSIMHYPFKKGLIRRPEEYGQNGINPKGGISDRDRAWVKSFYPPNPDQHLLKLEPFKSHQLSIAPAQQLNFRIEPTASRIYDIATFGESDTILVLFEDVNGQPKYLTADDDSGTDRNAHIRTRLMKGRSYILRLRLYYEQRSGETAVMIW